MSSNREVLELAAKAAGYECGSVNGGFRILMPGGCGTYGCTRLHPVSWNPLADDGDALRLANKLDISINHDEPICIATYSYQGYREGEYERGVQAWKVSSTDAKLTQVEEVYGSDRDGATRRAIVRMAAEIGRSLAGQEQQGQEGESRGE
jgi:hypothetical protein